MKGVGYMECAFRLLDKRQINRIKTLWVKLNQMHLKDSQYFKDHYENFTFEKRWEKFHELDDDHIRIEIADVNGTIVGYCISTIEKDVGEIDSIFIEEHYRKYGYGGVLIKNSIEWLKTNHCKKVIVAVAEGHESVFGFYQKFGFYPRMTYLQMKE